MQLKKKPTVHEARGRKIADSGAVASRTEVKERFHLGTMRDVVEGLLQRSHPARILESVVLDDDLLKLRERV